VTNASSFSDYYFLKLHLNQFSKTKSHKEVTITINVPLFKKLRDIIFFWWDNHFMNHFWGRFEGASTLLTPKLSLAALGTI